MDVYEATTKRRTIRRFKQDTIPFEILKKIINAGRLAPSSANLQPVEFVAIDRSDIIQKIFDTLKWAAYIAPEGNPPPDQRPMAYIVVLTNKEKNAGNCDRDAAAAIENMILVALEEGIGSCWMGAIDRNKIKSLLGVPEHITVDSVLALGYSNESPKVEEMRDSVKYWKDKAGTLHVPQRKIEDVLFHNKY